MSKLIKGDEQSNKQFQKSLFIFRRDLRLEDNTGLLFALEHSKEVIPCFIFTPEQIDDNPYRSDRCLQFMIESLEDLSEQLRERNGRLFLFYNQPEMIIEKCAREIGIDAVIVNQDYTPYSIARDKSIESVCKKLKLAFHSLEDILLYPILDTLKSDGKPYTVFTPFYRKTQQLTVKPAAKNPYSHYFSESITFAKSFSIYQDILPKRYQQAKGGRKACLEILQNSQQFSNYDTVRDFPASQGTTHLSPHLKFTTCSPREIYYAITKELGKHSELIRSLHWRDFFTSIAFHFPYVFQEAFRPKFKEIQWNNDVTAFKKWCEGKTGFPIVDAGMREMNTTGYMQNRVRMITASFLVKDLHIDWKWGEKYFAQKLIDYDPAINNGNWQWVASTGCDAQPYFRIFNPWSQQMKFDLECVYIKHWIPELSAIPCKVIHEWFLSKFDQPLSGYPRPIVDHPKEAKITIQRYKR